MIRASVHHFDMNVGSCVMGEAAEKILKQFRLQIADPLGAKSPCADAMGPPAEIDRRNAIARGRNGRWG